MRKLLTIALIATLAGCGGPRQAAPAAKNLLADAPAGAPVVTVDGEVVTEPLLQAWAQRRGLDLADAAQRQRAIDGLVDAMVLARDALNSNLGQNDEVRAALAQARIEQLANANVEAFRAAAPITDEQLKTFYDEEAARTGGIELQLQHILFADEASAKAALEVAKQPGADFEQVMQGYASTARQAKQLDWANLSQLPPELGQAARTLQDGELAPQPVQTQYGWHVFKRLAARPFTPPPIEQVREGAKRQLGEQVLRERIKALREKAKVVLPGGEALAPKG
jgi:peptidyl-prolyl cis-trans isomerase C